MKQFYMPEEQILGLYREARSKPAQIKILAELNLCEPIEMARWLHEHGEPLPSRYKKRVLMAPRSREATVPAGDLAALLSAMPAETRVDQDALLKLWRDARRRRYRHE